MNKEELEHYLNPQTYLDEVFSRYKSKYPWITKEDLDPTLHLAIEPVNGKFKFDYYRMKDDGTKDDAYDCVYSLDENDGDYLLYWPCKERDGSITKYKFDPEDVILNLCYEYDRYLPNNERYKFEWGYDINVYCEKAFEILKDKISWITKADLDSSYRFAIEKENDKFEYIEYKRSSDGDENRTVMSGMCSKDFVRRFVETHESYVMESNIVIAECSVPTPGNPDPGGWRLELYVIRRHQKGNYSLSVQGGDSNTGGGSIVLIPASCFEADNFDVFLARYIKAVPSYGMTRDELYNCREFRQFLGYK